jgi:ribosomal protein S18 acetylase RimI-like enzyme
MNDGWTKSIELRPCLAADRPFLYQVYASTRIEELSVTGWNEEQTEQFLRMQFETQHRYYHEVYADAAYDVILCEKCPAGRLYVRRTAQEIAIIDIAILPPFRNRGIGCTLLQQLFDEAHRDAKTVRIYVEHFNRALRLYERLGFRKIGDTGVYFHMEWSPLT